MCGYWTSQQKAILTSTPSSSFVSQSVKRWIGSCCSLYINESAVMVRSWWRGRENRTKRGGGCWEKTVRERKWRGIKGNRRSCEGVDWNGDGEISGDNMRSQPGRCKCWLLIYIHMGNFSVSLSILPLIPFLPQKHRQNVNWALLCLDSPLTFRVKSQMKWLLWNQKKNRYPVMSYSGISGCCPADATRGTVHSFWSLQ